MVTAEEKQALTIAKTELSYQDWLRYVVNDEPCDSEFEYDDELDRYVWVES